MAEANLRNFLRYFSEETLKARTEPVPEADVIDHANFPYAIAAGDNKAGLEHCATCGKPPTKTGINNLPVAFLFKDVGSAEEYRISGLCQACQDAVFKRDDLGITEEDQRIANPYQWRKWPT